MDIFVSQSLLKRPDRAPWSLVAAETIPNILQIASKPADVIMLLLQGTKHRKEHLDTVQNTGFCKFLTINSILYFENRSIYSISSNKCSAKGR